MFSTGSSGTVSTPHPAGRDALLDAQGKYAKTAAQRARTEELVKTAAASRALLNERVEALTGGQRELVIADANLKTAGVNLDYTEIRDPIAGETGRTKVTKGNVVGPDTGPLSVIVSLRPDVCDVSG